MCSRDRFCSSSLWEAGDVLRGRGSEELTAGELSSFSLRDRTARGFRN